MPKRIENLRETILQQAKQRMLESGYEALAMRDIAARCGIAVGTLYNYFPSKESLAAGVMLEDWRMALAQMKAGCAAAADLAGGLTALYRGVMAFSAQYRGIWASYGFAAGSDADFARRHRLLVRQLAACLGPLLEKEEPALPQADLFLAENVLICAGSSEVEFPSLLAAARQLQAAQPEKKRSHGME